MTATAAFLTLDQPLVPTLVTHLHNIANQDPTAYQNTLVILPTRRAVKELENALLDGTPQDALVLPRILAIHDLDTPLVPPALSATKHKGLILTLLNQLDPATSLDHLPFLVDFLDDRHTYEIDLGKFDSLVPDLYASHWQKASTLFLTFLKKWDDLCTQNGWIESAARSGMVFDALIAQWQTSPPPYPVIMAGLDGFIPGVKRFMTAVQDLPQGKVFIQGLVPACDPPEPEPLATHPNFLAHQLSCPGHPEITTSLPSARAVLLAHLMSHRAFEDRAPQTLSFEGIHLLENTTLAQEAQNVAILARRHLEKSTGVMAIVTPDSDLAHQIQQALARWHIRVDLAEGQSLDTHPLGRFVIESIDLQAPRQNPTLFLSILKSPFATLGFETPYALKKAVRRFERDILRQRDPAKSIESDESQVLMTRFDEATSDFFTLKSQGGEQTLETWIRSHLSLLNALSASLWSSPEGERVAACLQDLLAHHGAYPRLTVDNYRHILRQHLGQETLRDAINHPRLKILNPLQGAYISYDIGVLCGMTDGVWPQHPKVNPWLNRDMALALGLPDEQIFIGRAASLVCQNMMAPTVILSHAQRRGSDPTVLSRWILRLKALARYHGHLEALSLSSSLQEWGRRLDQPRQRLYLSPPMGMPPVEKRPRRFSISDVDRLFRDPYQVYAKMCLGLEPLAPLNEPLGAADYGTYVHQVLEQAVKQSGVTTGPDITPFLDLLLPRALTPEQSFLWRQTLGSQVPFIQSYLRDQQQQSLEILVEHKMTTAFEVCGHLYELVGKADRIDRLMDGTYEITDYKTGAVPSKADVLNRDAPQLPLLAYLFERTYPHAHVSTLSYVSLGGKKIYRFTRDDLITSVVDRLKETLQTYHTEHHGYAIHPYNAVRDAYNDYAPLERTAEWLDQAQEVTP